MPAHLAVFYFPRNTVVTLFFAAHPVSRQRMDLPCCHCSALIVTIQHHPKCENPSRESSKAPSPAAKKQPKRRYPPSDSSERSHSRPRRRRGRRRHGDSDSDSSFDDGRRRRRARRRRDSSSSDGSRRPQRRRRKESYSSPLSSRSPPRPRSRSTQRKSRHRSPSSSLWPVLFGTQKHGILMQTWCFRALVKSDTETHNYKLAFPRERGEVVRAVRSKPKPKSPPLRPPAARQRQSPQSSSSDPAFLPPEDRRKKRRSSPSPIGAFERSPSREDEEKAEIESEDLNPDAPELADCK